MLHELGLPYETRAILPRSKGMDDPEFRAVSTRGKVPMLQEGDVVVGESGAIVTYLADRHRENRVLIPVAGTPERAQHDDWCSFILMELDATALYVVRRHEGLPEVYGEAPVAVQEARRYFERQVGVIAEHFGDGRPYLTGREFAVADLLLVTCLRWASLISIALPAVLAPYDARVTARPAFAAAMAANFPPEAMAALQNLSPGKRA
jgi:glutathione S-transferase